MKMEREIHHIDEYFTENLGNIEFIPPDEVWNNITKELDRKRRIRLFAIWSGMAAGIAILISIGLYVGNIPKGSVIAETSQITSLKHHISKDLISKNKVVVAKNNTYPEVETTQNKSKAKKEELIPEQISNDVYNEHDTSKVLKNFMFAKAEIDKNTLEAPSKDQNGLVKDQNTPDVPLKDRISLISPKSSKLENNLPGISNTKQVKVSSLAYFDVIDPLQNSKIFAKQEKEKNKRWSVEGQVAPQYSYRNISEINGNLPNKAVYNKSEDGLVAYGGGLKVNYATGKRLSIQAGVYYSIMGQTMNKVYAVKEQAGMSTYSTNKKSAYWLENCFGSISPKDSKLASSQPQSVASPDVVYSAVYVNATSPTFLKAVDESYGNGSLIDHAKIIQQLKFIEIPLLARYRIIDGKIGCNLIGGVSTNVLVNNDVILKQDGSRTVIGETDNLQRFNYSGTVGVGLTYQWFKKINLTLEPTYKYYMNSITTNENMKVHLYSFGIFTGLVYKF
jgi:hypothetical protein